MEFAPREWLLSSYIATGIDNVSGFVENILLNQSKLSRSVIQSIYLLNESRYVKLANTMYRVLRNSRIPMFLHRKSNHVFTVWQHLVLLTIRQYEGKSYRMYVDWLVETHYLRMFLQLSRIPHCTTLQKLAARINGTILAKIIASFIILTGTRHIFAGIDSTGFKLTHASEYYTERETDEKEIH